MFCPNCGRQIPDGSKFCPYCGASLEGKEVNIPKSKSSRSIAKIIVPIILVIVILAGLFGIVKLIKHQQSSSIWPMFRYNAQHTGRCPYDTSKNNGTLKWKYQTGDRIDSSPAIAPNGTIYVGSEDGYLYAIGGK
jgi:predicted nucleic acid-binding Zn ribbon protein